MPSSSGRGPLCTYSFTACIAGSKKGTPIARWIKGDESGIVGVLSDGMLQMQGYQMPLNTLNDMIARGELGKGWWNSDPIRAYGTEINPTLAGALARAVTNPAAGAVMQTRDRVANLMVGVGDVGTAFTPGVNDLRDVKEVWTGRDAFSGEKLNWFGQRGVTLAMAAVPFASGAGARKVMGAGDDALKAGLKKLGKRLDDAAETGLKELGKNVDNVPRGGTYKLATDSGKVVKTGRTANLAKREAQHARMYQGLHFEVDKVTDSYMAQRGREQIVHDRFQPILNKIRPIRADHPLIDEYLAAGRTLGE